LLKEVQELVRKGVPKTKIAKVLKIGKATVYRYISRDPASFGENCKPSFTDMEPFQNWIISQINSGIMRNDVYRCIVKKGCKGGISQFYKFCQMLAEMEMIDRPGKSRIDELYDEQKKVKYHYVTRSQIFKHIWNGKGDICKDDIEFIKNSFPVVGVLDTCLLQFRNIFEIKSKESLSDFIAAYNGCDLQPIKKFAESIQKDIGPVTNAVVEKYSNGFVEGTNNKLKLIKRTAYGRCKLPLLKSKILLSGFF